MERVRIRGDIHVLEELLDVLGQHADSGSLSISDMRPAIGDSPRPTLGQSPTAEIVIAFAVGIASSAAWDGAKAFVSWLQTTRFKTKLRAEIVLAEDSTKNTQRPK